MGEQLTILTAGHKTSSSVFGTIHNSTYNMSRELNFPTEILSMILTLASSPPDYEACPSTWAPRNGDLARMSQVSRQWHQTSLQLLYGSLCVVWRASTCLALLRSFVANPALHALVRVLNASVKTENAFVVEWILSEEGARTLGEAEKAFPTAAEDTPSAEWQSMMAASTVAAIVACGDSEWLGTDEAVEEGELAFWNWVAEHSLLRRLVISFFSHRILVSDKLNAVLGALETAVAIESSPDGFTNALSAVQDLSVANLTRASRSRRSKATPLPHLVHLRALDSPKVCIDILRRHPPALRSLTIVNVDSKTLAALADALPFAPELTTLELTLPYPPMVSKTFLKALKASNIERLACNAHPCTDLIPFLPPTIQGLLILAVWEVFVESDLVPPPSPQTFDFGPIERAVLWKKQYHLDQLEVVALTMSPLSELGYPDQEGNRKRIAEIAKSSEAQGVLVHVTELPVADYEAGSDEED
ncbi:hypothetical protein RQP46_000661 [Phenoliferia psychrophenolica]